ncbi:MAG: hypothetical protein JWL86_5400 [Rhizobium sp.]|nr:hypothetical protein [Rhizobium sp.]
MTDIISKNKNRIDVWPESAIAQEARSGSSKVFGRMTVWPSSSEARGHLSYDAGGDGGGSSPYVAKAINTDGSVLLSNSAIACVDNNKCSTSCWFNLPEIVFGEIWAADPTGEYQNSSGFSPNNGGCFDQVTATNTGVPLMSLQTIVAPGVWNHALITCDSTAGLAKYYLNGVDVGLLQNNYLPGGTPFDTDTMNGKLFTVLGDTFDGDSTIGSVADVWIGLGVSLLDETGDIPLSTLRLFIDADGKPVDPSGFPSAACLFSGDATTFVTNQGTGGAFILTGTPTTIAGPTVAGSA